MGFLKKLFSRNEVNLGIVSYRYSGKKWYWSGISLCADCFGVAAHGCS